MKQEGYKICPTSSLTDSNSDIPFQEVDRYDLKIVYMPYSIDGSDEASDLGRGDVIPNFYAAMRGGKTPTTSLLTKEKYIEYFEPYLADGEDILFICFSSELSGTYANAVLAQRELAEKYPDARLEVVNSRNVSMGEAYLAMEAAKQRVEGKTMDETIAWLEGNKYNVRYWFTVDDLKYLKRGGRTLRGDGRRGHAAQYQAHAHRHPRRKADLGR